MYKTEVHWRIIANLGSITAKINNNEINELHCMTVCMVIWYACFLLLYSITFSLSLSFSLVCLVCFMCFMCLCIFFLFLSLTMDHVSEIKIWWWWWWCDADKTDSHWSSLTIMIVVTENHLRFAIARERLHKRLGVSRTRLLYYTIVASLLYAPL